MRRYGRLVAPVWSSFVATIALAGDHTGDKKIEIVTLQCATTVKAEPESLSAAAQFSIEISRTFEGHDHIRQDPAVVLETGKIVIPSRVHTFRTWEFTTASWKVKRLGETTHLSFADKFHEHCAGGCVVHGWQGIDVDGMYFIAAPFSGKSYWVDRSEDAVKLYSGLLSEPVQLAEFISGFPGLRFEDIIYRDPEFPNRVEHGTCER